MADQTYPVPENPVYDPNIRALQDNDPARATTVFNPLVVRLIENTHAVKRTGDVNALRIEEVSKQASEAGDASHVKLSDGTTVEAAIGSIGATLPKKADLVAGKVPAAQLPAMDYVPTTRKVNGKPLSSDVSLTAADLGALPSSSIGYGTCSTASNTNAKAGALSGFALAVGAIVGIRFANGNTAAAATLNVNSTGAKPIYYGDAYVTGSMITAGMTAMFQYNGSQWALLNPAVNASSLFIIDITFGASLSGKAFTVNANGFSYSGTVPGSLTAAVVASVPSALYTIACDGNAATVSTTNYFGVYPVTITSTPSVFANATWAQIAAAVAADNVPASWKIGDTKNITLTGGEVLTIAIYGKKHDDLAGGGKAGITFGLKNLMAANRQMNTSNTNVGGFTGSAMYSWLQNDLYNSLPADLKTVIKSVNKKTSAGNQSTTINTNAMKIFLFSEVECFGSTPAGSAAGEGAQYPIFTDNTSRIKYQANGTGAANIWWERSPLTGGTTYFCFVSSVGSAISGASSSLGVCFGFCI